VWHLRDALLTCYLEVMHLMYFFHLVKNSKEKLRTYGKDVQMDVLLDVQQLHSCCTESLCQSTFRELLHKWNDTGPDFATYFTLQWMTINSFSHWKTYCSKPGKCFM
jgi:hypothetical protein